MKKLSAYLYGLSLAIFGYLFFKQGYYIFKSAIDLPILDDWEAVGPERIPEHLNWEWLLAPHNEHRILFTRLQAYILYNINFWDVRVHIQLNYVIYGFICALILWQIFKSTKNFYEAALVTLFANGLNSQFIAGNHLWAYQSHFHFVLLFPILGIQLLFARKDSTALFFFGVLCLAACSFSFSTGVVSSFVLTLASMTDVLFKLKFRNLNIRVGIVRLFILSAVMIPCFYFHIINHAVNIYHAAPVSPFYFLFWDYFFNIYSLGFGYAEISSLLGFICFTPILFLFFLNFKKTFADRGSIQNTLLLLNILIFIGVIAYGRGNFPIASSHSYRYCEFSAQIAALSALLILRLPKNILKFSALLILFVAFLIGTQDAWLYRKNYKRIFDQRTENLKCINDYIHQRRFDATCPGLYPGDLKDHIEIAREMNVSFIQKALKKP